MKINNIFKLFLAIIFCQLVGLVGSIFTFPSIGTWYRFLNKPLFNPPNWIFGPVWATLYLLMGISLYLIWQSKSKKKSNKYLFIFYIQLFLNFLWSIIFFGLHNPLLAFIEILFLWLAIILTMIGFYKVSKPAGILLIPYILWVSFASILNLAIYILNK